MYAKIQIFGPLVCVQRKQSYDKTNFIQRCLPAWVVYENQEERNRTMSRRRSQRSTAAAFPALAPGTQIGLRRLVQDNIETVAQMLDVEHTADDDQDLHRLDKLCEQCAQVMKQQQLSPSSFLARFFDATVLAAQARLYQKSDKGSAATLADRLATAWAQPEKQKMPPAATSHDEEPSPQRKRDEKLVHEDDEKDNTEKSSNNKKKKTKK